MGEGGFKVVVVSEGGIVTNDNDGIVVDSGEKLMLHPEGLLNAVNNAGIFRRQSHPTRSRL